MSLWTAIPLNMDKEKFAMWFENYNSFLYSNILVWYSVQWHSTGKSYYAKIKLFSKW